MPRVALLAVACFSAPGLANIAVPITHTRPLGTIPGRPTTPKPCPLVSESQKRPRTADDEAGRIIEARPRGLGTLIGTAAKPGHCQEPDPNRAVQQRGRSVCGQLLAAAASPLGSIDPSVLATQQRIMELLNQSTTTSFGVPVNTAEYLNDLAVISRHAVVVTEPTNKNRQIHRASAQQSADAIALGLDVLAATSLAEAAHRLKPFLSGPLLRSGALRAAFPDSWRDASVWLQRGVLKARDRHLRPADRLRFATIGSLPRPPDSDPMPVSEHRHQGVPQQFWPSWTLRLLPDAGLMAKHYGPALAACVLLPGLPVSLRQACQRFGPTTCSPNVNHVLGELDARGHIDTVLDVLGTLADHLDTHGSPIDYGRRRRLFVTPTADLLTYERWKQICDEAGIVAGPRNHLHAAQSLIEDLTGTSPFHLPPPLTLHTGSTAATYHNFYETMTPQVAEQLRSHATSHLKRHHINEPLTWAPPLDWAPPAVRWPGSEFQSLNADGLSDLLIRQRLTPREAAAQLGTTIDHVRLFLRDRPLRAEHPRRRRNPTSKGPSKHPRAGPLSASQLRYRYEQCGWTWERIARHAGCSKQTARKLGQKAGIASRTAGRRPKLDISRAWLQDQYIYQRRTLPDIAAELCISTTAIARIARDFGIDLRKPGGASHAVALHPAIADLPDWILPASKANTPSNASAASLPSPTTPPSTKQPRNSDSRAPDSPSMSRCSSACSAANSSTEQPTATP